MTDWNLDLLFRHELRKTYLAEELMLVAYARAALPSGERAAGTLRTKERLQRLEQVLALSDGAPAIESGLAFAGMLAETEALIAGIADPPARDAATLLALHTGAHYLLARYSALVAWAKRLRLEEPAAILAATLQEELTSLLRSTEKNDPPNSPSMGERLTALFDRKR
jgi:ferritin-like metal-binding protein YciE